ncbi:MAG: hypothetical protein ACFFG0_45020 [Candidatus Thorarchaeota archaeon]
MQGTIRAIDNKLNFIMIILVIPIMKLNAIYSHANSFITQHETFVSYVMLLLFVLFWGLAFIFTLRGLSSIDNSSKHIDPVSLGTYHAQYFKFSFFDSLLIPGEKKPNRTINDILHFLPTNMEELQKELAFEQLKLSYICGIKIVRQKHAYLFLLLWMLTGSIIWWLSLF